MNNESDKLNNIVEKKMRDLGEGMAKMYDRALLKQFKFSERLTIKCARCQISMMNHKSALDHPFFLDNLEHLEWKATGKPPIRGDRISFDGLF